MNIPVNVYTEATPNPSAMKFVSSIPLLQEGILEYFSADEASACPMAKQLFSFSGIKSVFITANFITVTKESEIDWFEISGIIREYIRGYLMSGEKIFISNPFTNQKQNQPSSKNETSNSPVSSTDPEIETQIINMLEEYVKPAVEQDGGAIHFKSFDNGIVTVTLKGSCSGCPSSTLTLKSGIENLLKQMIPAVTEVVAEAE